MKTMTKLTSLNPDEYEEVPLPKLIMDYSLYLTCFFDSPYHRGSYEPKGFEEWRLTEI